MARSQTVPEAGSEMSLPSLRTQTGDEWAETSLWEVCTGHWSSKVPARALGEFSCPRVKHTFSTDEKVLTKGNFSEWFALHLFSSEVNGFFVWLVD